MGGLMAEEKRGRGRPTKYDPSYPDQAEIACKLGATDDDLCQMFSCSNTTLATWKIEYPDFLNSVRRGRDYFDSGLVENALKRRAMGMFRTIEKLDKFGEIRETREEVPPDPQAIKFWLANRDANRWKDKQEHELSGSINVTPIINYGVKKD